MGYQNPRAVRRVLTWVIVLGVLVGVAYQWGGDLLHFATGQDILDDLAADMAAWTRPTPTPAVGPGAASSGSGEQGELPAADRNAVAADGFPVQPRRHVLRYTVQPGDALFTIAEQFSIHPNTIFWANTETLQDNVHLILVGAQLYILPLNGVYHLSDGELTVAEIAAQYGVTPGDILLSEYNVLSTFDGDYAPPAGMHIVVPGGRRDYISWRSPIRTGTQSGSANPEGTIHPGSCRQIYVGTGGAGNYMNPLGATPYRLTNFFAAWHPGLDLAADRNTPIYASETGVVVFAGWHRHGYGELVIIDHGEGWTTYYAHLANRFVGCGDQVSRGQYVGEMGMTGNATGIHLHFEIRENDQAKDPRQYIDAQDNRTTTGG